MTVQIKEIILKLMFLSVVLCCLFNFAFLNYLFVVHFIFLLVSFFSDVIKKETFDYYDKMERKYILKHYKWLI